MIKGDEMVELADLELQIEVDLMEAMEARAEAMGIELEEYVSILLRHFLLQGSVSPQ